MPRSGDPTAEILMIVMISVDFEKATIQWTHAYSLKICNVTNWTLNLITYATRVYWPLNETINRYKVAASVKQLTPWHVILICQESVKREHLMDTYRFNRFQWAQSCVSKCRNQSCATCSLGARRNCVSWFSLPCVRLALERTLLLFLAYRSLIQTNNIMRMWVCGKKSKDIKSCFWFSKLNRCTDFDAVFHKTWRGEIDGGWIKSGNGSKEWE